MLTSASLPPDFASPTPSPKVMERDPSCNAGHGSNLAKDGVVEEDACLACDDGSHGAVGAARGLGSAIGVALELHLCDESREQDWLYDALTREAYNAHRPRWCLGFDSALNVGESGLVLAACGGRKSVAWADGFFNEAAVTTPRAGAYYYGWDQGWAAQVCLLKHGLEDL